MPANFSPLGLDALVPAEQLHRLGWVVVHSLWQAAAVAAVLAMALRIVPRRSALALETRYVLATLALVALPVACAVTYALVEPPAAGAHAVAAEPVASPGVANRVVIVPAKVASMPGPGAAAPAVPAVSSVAFMTHRAADAIAPWLPWCAAAWLAGAMAAAARLGGGWWLTRRLVAQAMAPTDARWQARVERWKNVLGIARRVRLLASARIDVPMVIGWLEPVVVWPLAALTGMPADQIDAILAHELAHVRRHDVFVNLLQSCIETLFFHHPAAWWISAQVRAEREHCADDLAIRAITGARAGSAFSYAAALVSLEERRQRSALAVAADGGSLVDRIARLAGVEPTAGHPARLAAALLVVVVVAIVTGVATLAVSSRPAEAADRTDALPEDTNAITSLTPEQAAKLAAEFPGVKAKCFFQGEVRDSSGCLPLNGLTSLDVETAKALAKYARGPLLLNGLTELAPESAAALVASRAPICFLYLNGLKTISPECAQALAGRLMVYVFLDGVTDLPPESAKALETFESLGLSLNGLKTLSPECAESLAACKGHSLSLGGLVDLTPELAKPLSAFGGILELGGLKTLSPECAAVLASGENTILMLHGLDDLSPETAAALAPFAGVLSLDSLNTLAPECATALGAFQGSVLSLGSLTDLEPACAKALAAIRERLALTGLKTLSPESAVALADFGGDLWVKTDLLEPIGSAGLPLTVATAKVVAHASGNEGKWVLPHVTAFDVPDSVEIAGILAKARLPVVLPNLKRISPRTFAALVRKKDVLLPDMATVEIIAEPDGSGPRVADDFVLPDGFNERQAMLRQNLQLEPVEVAAEPVAERVDPAELKSLTPEQARTIAAEHEGRVLFLNGLTELSPEAAAALGDYEGCIQFARLTKLSPETAAALASSKAEQLDFSGLKILEPQVATALARFQGGMLAFVSLPALSAESAAALATFTGWLSFWNVATLSPEAAAALAGYEGESLYLHGLKTLSPEAAAALESCKCQKLYLHELRELSPAAARLFHRAIPAHKAFVLSDVAFERPDAVEMAEVLMTVSTPIVLSNLKRISPRTFAALAQNENVLFPDMKKVTFIAEPDGSEPGIAEDVVLPDGFKEQQAALRTKLRDELKKLKDAGMLK